MPSPAKSPDKARTHAVNLRMREDTRALIDRAARAQGRTRSDFMIDAARRAAEDAILDQTVFLVDRAAYDRFLEILDDPSGPNDKLKELMRRPAPWETP